MNRELAKVIVMRRPPQKAVCVASEGQREATTGGFVSPLAAGPRLVVVPPPMVRLERVWAVAEMPASPELPKGPEERPDAPPELAFYRKYTEALLRRYLTLSMTAGRVPSLMGRELFRGNVTHCRTHNMEDVVIFCMDMEKKLALLPAIEQRLITRIALQNYRQGEVAAMLGLSLRSVVRRYAETLDRLTAMLLEVRMLEPLKSCQEGKEVECELSA